MLRVLFTGTPDISVPSLMAIAREHNVVGVLTNPPSGQGRGRTMHPTPVAEAAEKLNAEGTRHIEILCPEKLDEELRNRVAALNPDILVCFAYGKIFGPKFLALFPMGGINLHPSLLPKYRGCAPVPAAILNRDAETGITIQRIAREMDSGDILLRETIRLTGTETAGELLSSCGQRGAPLLLDVLARIESGTAVDEPQNSEHATYCTMLKKEDGIIDWNRSALEIDAQIRAFSPWPGAFTAAHLPGKEEALLLIHRAVPITDTVLLYEFTGGKAPAGKPGTIAGIDKKEGILVQTGDGLLALQTLQWKTKKSLDWKSFLNGSRDFPEAVLGEAQAI